MNTKTQLKELTVQNRFVRSATYTMTCDTVSGVPTERFYEKCAEIARGNPGIFVQEHAFVAERGRASSYQLGIQSDMMVQWHKKCNQMIKDINS